MSESISHNVLKQFRRSACPLSKLYRGAHAESQLSCIKAGRCQVHVSGAGGAAAVEEEFMAGHAEAVGKLGLHVDAATLQLEELAALVALEVMVMLFARDLVACGVAGNVDGSQPLFLNQEVNVAVDRCDRKAVHLLLREAQGLVVRERAIGR